LTPAVRAAISAVLAGLQQLVEAFDYPSLPALRREVEQGRALLDSSEASPDIDDSLTRCVQASLLATTYVLAQRGAEKREAAALVAAVREAIEAASANSSAFRDDVQRSTQRFEEIATSNQVLELQARLRKEVALLKTTIANNRVNSQSRNQALANRIQSLEQQLVQVRQESALDPLTGVTHRGGFDRACVEWLRGGTIQFTLLMLDIDDFKTINDTHGHVEGDRSLAAVGAALRATARSKDVVARIGGDEFAVLALDLPLRAAEGLFTRLGAALATHAAREGCVMPAPTLSGGATEPAAGDTVRSLMQRADEALYDAKRRGKNRIATRQKPLLREM
jgi:diguanylate cyclase